jgi:hypothetical protein
MRLSLRTLVLSSAALCSTAAFAANEVRVNVPFNFVVKNHTYQSGAYKVVIEPTRSQRSSPVDDLARQAGPR